MLKIVLIVKYYYPLKRPSGILRFVMNLSEKLGKQVNLTIITCKFDKRHKSKERYNNYDIIRINSPFYIFSAIRSAKLKPNLIIFGTGISKLWLLLAVSIIFRSLNVISSRFYKHKKSTFVLYQFVDLNYNHKFLTKYIYKVFKKVICTNKSLYNFYLNKNHKDSIFFIPPGVNLAKFHHIKYKINDKIRIGFFGHLSYNKGSDLLLSSFLKMNNDNTELLLAGLGNLSNSLKTKTLNHKNIYIKAYIDNIEEVIASCDLLVFPYRHSQMILGLSLSAIEGLAMGRPLLVSNNNCLRDLVVHGENGYIFKDEDELTKYMSKLTNNKNMLQSFSLESKEKSLEFDIDFICNKLIYSLKKNENREQRIL